MRIRYLWPTVLFVAITAVGSASLAEMYKYRDAQGNVCFTDNLAQIPEDQRPGALTLKSVAAEGGAEKKVGPQQTEVNKPEDAFTSDEVVVDDQTIAALNDRKKELDEEFSVLMAEKYTLLQEKQKLDGLAGRDVKARQAYEGKVTDLNNRIADFASRRDAFQKECDRVKQVLESNSPAADEENPYEGVEASTE